MLHLLFLFMCGLILGNKMKPYSYGLLARFDKHALRTISSNQGLIGLYEMACVFKGRINPQSPFVLVNLKESPLSRNKLKFTTSKCRSPSRTSCCLNLKYLCWSTYRSSHDCSVCCFSRDCDLNSKRRQYEQGAVLVPVITCI